MKPLVWMKFITAPLPAFPGLLQQTLLFCRFPLIFVGQPGPGPAGKGIGFKIIDAGQHGIAFQGICAL